MHSVTKLTLSPDLEQNQAVKFSESIVNEGMIPEQLQIWISTTVDLRNKVRILEPLHL